MQKLFDIKKTQIEMARDRGYDTTEDQSILSMTLDQFENYVNQLITLLKGSKRSVLSKFYHGIENPSNKLLVQYGGRTSLQQKQVPSDIVVEFIGKARTYNVTEAILIVDAPLSFTGSEALNNLKTISWQIFHDSDLSYNPVKHVDTPQHILLPPNEVADVLQQMKVDKSKLLLIKESDPVIRYYGWKAGNVVRINRDDSSISILTPKSINYRVIIK